MRGGLGDLMKHAQQLQDKLQKAREELATLEVTGRAAGGKLTVLMSGKHEVKNVHIDASLLGDAEMLADLVAVACNDAATQIDAVMQQRFSGLGLPAGMKLPF